MLKPRILIVRFDLAYVNPTGSRMPFLFTDWADVTCFGPGHVSADEWARGFWWFLRLNPRFDLIVVDDHLITASLSDGPSFADLVAKYQRIFACPFAVPDALRGARRVLDAILETGLPVIACRLQFDYWPMTASDDAYMRQPQLHVFGWGRELVPWLRDVDVRGEGSWIHGATDRWRQLVEDRADHVISLPGFISDSDVCWTPLAERPHVWAVPGTRYRDRQRAIDQLKSIGGSRHYWTYRAANKMGLPVLSTARGICWARRGFQQTLNTAQRVFTCGSALQYPIRKFFEIPAAGCVLVAPWSMTSRALGFQHGVNSVSCDPNMVWGVDHCSYDEQAIADAGRSFVLQQHSLTARSRQMQQCVEAILNGTFAGSAWQRGQFVVHPQSHERAA